MNKIMVDNIILNNEKFFANNFNYSTVIVNGNSELNLFNSNIMELNIIVNDNSILIVNYFGLINENTCKINITTYNKASVIFNHSFKNLVLYDLEINTEFYGCESSIIVNLNGVNDKGKSIINVNGYVNNDAINNVLDENVRVINLSNGTCISNPNMFIDTSKVIANHNTTIGAINEDELFYLMSKGLDRNSSIKLISMGYLIIGIDNDEIKGLIKDIL